MEAKNLDKKSLAAAIEHTELRIDASYGDIRRLCLEASAHGFASVVVYPVNVPLAVRLLRDTPVKVGAVVGFHSGAYTIEGKVFETLDVIKKGAQEIDYVINVGALKGGNRELVRDEMRAIRDAAGELVTKAILETCLLTNEETEVACRMAEETHIDFVKTSTGFASRGATVEDVRLLRRVVVQDVGVKAAGGIRTTRDAIEMIEAGASRLGTSAGIAIVEGLGA
jgi:deoxyribose-phosphate aldolase